MFKKRAQIVAWRDAWGGGNGVASNGVLVTLHLTRQRPPWQYPVNEWQCFHAMNQPLVSTTATMWYSIHFVFCHTGV
jgi:hypothetical protein